MQRLQLIQPACQHLLWILCKGKRNCKRSVWNRREVCVPAQSLSNTEQLQEAFRWIRMHEQDIRSQLMQRQAEYKEYQNTYAEDLRR